jgi:hypothetical protein
MRNQLKERTLEMKQSTPPLKASVDAKRRISQMQVRQLRAQLHKQLPRPEVKLKGSRKVQPGDPVVFVVKGYPMPVIDLYEGKISKRKILLRKMPLMATFKGKEASITTTASYSPKTRLVKMTVPEDAVKGRVTIHFPVREYYGKTAPLKKIDPQNKALRKIIGKWQDENLKCDKNKDDGSRRDDRAPVERNLYVNVNTTVLWPYWLSCNLRRCRLGCPQGAIRFDTHNRCYVDPDRCLGQSYQTTRTYGREDDVECWHCFNAGDTTVSTRCPRRRIRKVVNIGEECCSNCTPAARQSGGLTLMELCCYGAISVVGGKFVVDKSMCQGCQICYDGINCFFNRESDVFERELRMVAHIGTRAF